MGSALPVGREVLIPRQLSVAIDESGIRTASGMLPALLYTTEGLERHGQREMVFAVIRTGAPAPGYPLTMARTVHRLATEGRLVEAGDVSVFGQPGIDVDGRVTGFVYATAPEDIPSTVEFQRRPLVALPLLAGETAVVQRFGYARVLSLLGAQERYYPHPWWFRPGRAPVVDDAEFRAATMLSKAPAYNLPFLRVVHIGDRLELTLTAGGVGEELGAFQEALREAADVCAFLPGLAPVPQTYVWAPGQRGPAAIVAPDGERSTRIGCNFLLLVRGNVEPTARQLEDGFAVLLTGAMYARLRQAVDAGRPVEIGLPAGAVSTLAFRVDARPNPTSRSALANHPGLTAPGSAVSGSAVPGSAVPGSAAPGSTASGSTASGIAAPGITVQPRLALQPGLVTQPAAATRPDLAVQSGTAASDDGHEPSERELTRSSRPDGAIRVDGAVRPGQVGLTGPGTGGGVPRPREGQVDAAGSFGQRGGAAGPPLAEPYRTGELTIYHPRPADDTDRDSANSGARALRHVDRGRIVLLTSEAQLRRATTAAELGDFIDRARGIVDRAFTGVRHGTEELMVEFRLGPSRPVSVRIMARPEAPPRELQVVLERQLHALRPPTIRYTEVAFQLHLQLYR